MRQKIVSGALKVFNEHGLQLTLEQLATHLQLTKGRITNYFPNKELLFVALSQEYDFQYATLSARIRPKEGVTLSWFVKASSAIMDLQYEHRSTIIFATSTHPSQKELHKHVTQSYQNNILGVRQTIQAFVFAGILKPEILKPRVFEVFSFQLVNLFTTWVISLAMYNSNSTYAKMKSIYLEGIVRCFYPHLTPDGLKQFNNLRFK